MSLAHAPAGRRPSRGPSCVPGGNAGESARHFPRGGRLGQKEDKATRGLSRPAHARPRASGSLRPQRYAPPPPRGTAHTDHAPSQTTPPPAPPPPPPPSLDVAGGSAGGRRGLLRLRQGARHRRHRRRRGRLSCRFPAVPGDQQRAAPPALHSRAEAPVRSARGPAAPPPRAGSARAMEDGRKKRRGERRPARGRGVWGRTGCPEPTGVRCAVPLRDPQATSVCTLRRGSCDYFPFCACLVFVGGPRGSTFWCFNSSLCFADLRPGGKARVALILAY
jgi:hypothetical protein